MEINNNIQKTMQAAKNIAQQIDSPLSLDDGTLEMILYLTQKAISNIKELHQKYKFSETASPTPESMIKQISQMASNAYELLNTLEQMRKSNSQKDAYFKEQKHKLHDTMKSLIKDMPLSSRYSKQ